MSLHLRIESVRTTSQLRSAANANELEAEGYTIEGECVVVESQAEADELLSTYSNLKLELDRGEDDSRESPRAEMTTEGVDMPADDATADGAEFDEDAWLDQEYMARAESVRAGEVDEHLDRIETIERSQTVEDAVAERRAEL